MNIQTSNLLEQAQLARTAANWSLLLQCLQQLMSEVGSRGSERQGEKRKRAEGVEGAEEEQRTTHHSPLPTPLSWAIDIFTWGDFHQRWDVAKLLPKFGREAIAPLLEILADEDADEELRWFVVRSLGSFDSPEAIAALVELL